MEDSDATLEVGSAPTPGQRGRESGDALPSIVGRYEVQERIGAGGMGVVYRARDPELDRIVALKVVRPSARDVEATARLAREAQSMAKLAHPNVVPVYDVGLVGDRVFVAMEFVPGRTLTRWLQGQPGWARAVEVMMQAGRGLVAAHEAGLLHRDFKPDNVMVGDDGRVRVMDFGLARAEHEAPSETAASTPGATAGVESLQTPLTHAGNVVGTPAYMAPEQHLGQPLDARADQYAFCVTLYQAVYGERPFPGGSGIDALADRKRRGELLPAPSHAGVPRWLRAVIVRGLAGRPGDRWPSMAALLAALDPSRRRRRRIGAVAAVGGFAALGLAWPDSASTPARSCETTAAPVHPIWNETRRREIRTAFADTGAPFALATFERSATWIDGYTRRWAELWHESCERAATEPTSNLEDRRSMCLRQRRGELAALVDRMATADPDIVEQAVTKATALPPLDACEDDEALAQGLEPPPASLRTEVSDIRDALAQQAHLAKVGDEDVEAARALVARARDTAYDPVVAEALMSLGVRQQSRGSDFDATIETLTEAYVLASTCGHDAKAFDAARMLTFVTGFRAGRFEEAETWAEHGRAILARTGNDPLDEAVLRASIASIYQERGPFERAEAEYQRILAIRRRVHGQEHPEYANVLNGMGDLLRRMGRYAEARGYLEESLSIYETLYGPEHPHAFTTIGNLAVVLRMLGDTEAAEPLLARTVELAKLIFGPEHPNVAMAMGNYANLFYERGDYERSYAIMWAAVPILERSLGADHPAYAMALDNSAGSLVALGRYEQARPLIARALDIRQRVLGEDHPEVARSLSARGRLANETGDPEAALRDFSRAIGIMERTVGLAHHEALRMRSGEAKALETLGRHQPAKAAWKALLGTCELLDERDSACDDARTHLDAH